MDRNTALRMRLRKIIREHAQKNSRSLPTSRGAPRLASILFEAEGAEAEETVDPSAVKALSDLVVSKGPSDVVKFLNGPGADPRVRALISAGSSDGSPEDEAATLSEGSSTIGELIPTQIEIELTKSIAYPLAKFDAMKKMISGGAQRIGPPGNDMIVTSGKLIVDGHHRWSSLFSVAGPEGIIASINVELPESDAASVLAITQTAIAATLDGPVPKAKAGGMNILGKGKDELAGLITSAVGESSEAGEILSDDFVQKCIADDTARSHFGIEEDDDISSAREAIIEKVADNLSQMNQPAEGSPPRVDMPQLDKAGGGVTGALEKLASGDVNYKPPFTAKESRLRRDNSIILERWQKLAGIIKG